MVPLRLSAYEQDALAQLASVAASCKWEIFEKQVLPSQELLSKFTDVVMRFEDASWDKLYDKLHRTGANS